eukprot:GHVS01022220.1.p1 GENE.GHVS01022220.1~~GHVS01022220.1.p1  ORF type:complete len:605 (-),score=45.35 GHVS01022220.1:2112-3926(-)
MDILVDYKVSEYTSEYGQCWPNVFSLEPMAIYLSETPTSLSPLSWHVLPLSNLLLSNFPHLLPERVAELVSLGAIYSTGFAGNVSVCLRSDGCPSGNTVAFLTPKRMKNSLPPGNTATASPPRQPEHSSGGGGNRRLLRNVIITCAVVSSLSDSAVAVKNNQMAGGSTNSGKLSYVTRTVAMGSNGSIALAGNSAAVATTHKRWRKTDLTDIKVALHKEGHEVAEEANNEGFGPLISCLTTFRVHLCPKRYSAALSSWADLLIIPEILQEEQSTEDSPEGQRLAWSNCYCEKSLPCHMLPLFGLVKPFGLPCESNVSNYKECLAYAAASALGLPTLYLPQRLDTCTTGVVLATPSKTIVSHANKIFREKSTCAGPVITNEAQWRGEGVSEITATKTDAALFLRDIVLASNSIVKTYSVVVVGDPCFSVLPKELIHFMAPGTHNNMLYPRLLAKGPLGNKWKLCVCRIIACTTLPWNVLGVDKSVAVGYYREAHCLQHHMAPERVQGDAKHAASETSRWDVFDHLYELTVELQTGRKHQLRAQLSAAGSPVLGDTMYTPMVGATIQQPARSSTRHGGSTVWDIEHNKTPLATLMSRCTEPTQPIG